MISVIVPVYNMEVFLPRCMNSLLGQTDSAYEIILVDDGSTDGSAALCDRFAAEYPGLVRCIHKENGGLSSSRNAGVLAAKGSYVIFPDPDDWTEKEYLSSFQKLMRENEAELFCTGYYVDYDESSRPSAEGKQGGLISSRKALELAVLPGGMCGFAWNKLFRLDLIREHGLQFLDDVGTTEDLDFLARYLKFCDKVYYEPKLHTYHYYQRAGAATHQSSFSKRRVDSLRTYEKIIKDRDTSRASKLAAKSAACNAAIGLLEGYCRSGICDRPVYERILRCLRQNLSAFINCSSYNMKRKLQAVFACIMPKTFAKTKTAWRH